MNIRQKALDKVPQGVEHQTETHKEANSFRKRKIEVGWNIKTRSISSAFRNLKSLSNLRHCEQIRRTQSADYRDLDFFTGIKSDKIANAVWNLNHVKGTFKRTRKEVLILRETERNRLNHDTTTLGMYWVLPTTKYSDRQSFHAQKSFALTFFHAQTPGGVPQ